jgi:flagellar protein FlaJ
MDKKIFYLSLGAGALVLAVLNFLFFKDNVNLMYFLFIIIIMAALTPYVMSVILEVKIQRDKESRFLEFARDLVESVRSGTPISKAIINVKKRDYGPLSPHVAKLANQLSLGIPLTQALINFASDTESKVISRAVGLISEAERSGGEIDTILNSVANSVNQIEQLKKERSSSVYSLVVQGYIIFFVFIVIVLVLQYLIVPMSLQNSGAGFNDLTANVGTTTQKPNDLSQPLLILLLVQSFFAGFVIGKISEGSFKDGVKHSFILVALTLVVSFGAKLIWG